MADLLRLTQRMEFPPDEIRRLKIEINRFEDGQGAVTDVDASHAEAINDALEAFAKSKERSRVLTVEEVDALERRGQVPSDVLEYDWLVIPAREGHGRQD